MHVKDIILATSMHGIYGTPLVLGRRPLVTTTTCSHRPMDLETRQLRMLVAIADEGTVTRAAAVLNVSQPALSHGLRALERSVGVALFARQPRGLVPTEAGDRLLRTARAVLREIERARTEVSRGAIGRGELLRLSTECYTAYHWLPPVFQEFRERCPGVELRVIPSAIGHPLKALREETLDVAIGVRREAYAGFVYHELFEDELLVVMPPNHPLASEPFISPQHFADEHVLLFTEDPFESSLMRLVLSPAGVIPREISYVPAPEALLELVKTGLGISVFAKWAVARHLRDGELVGIPLTKTGRRRQWSAAVRRTLANRSAISTLIALLREHAPDFQSVPTKRSATRVRKVR